MNNILQLGQILRNPQAFLQQAIKSSNPIIKNALEMYQRGDIDGINKIAENLCKERGVNMDDAMQKIKSTLGIN